MGSVQLESREGLPEGLSDASEDEPWWRLLGSPMVRVWRAESGPGGSGGLRLQFREDHENPKVIALVPEAERVRVFIDPKGRS